MGQEQTNEQVELLKSNSKRKGSLYLPLILLLIVAAAVSVFIGFYAFSGGFARNISTIETTIQDNNGAPSTNYIPVLAETVNWDLLSEDDRLGTARYAINKSIAQAETDGVSIFAVMGVRANRPDSPVFLYTGGESLVLYVDEEPVRALLNG
jgi:hypothetical protein